MFEKILMRTVQTHVGSIRDWLANSGEHFSCSATINNIWKVQVNGISKRQRQRFCQTSTLKMKSLVIDGTGVIKRQKMAMVPISALKFIPPQNGMVIFLASTKISSV